MPGPMSSSGAAGGGGATNATIVAPLGTGAAGTGVRVEGEGTAGAAVGGILTVQGAAGAVNIPVSIAAQSLAELVANINQIGGAALALGQTTMANSIPVTIASNQTAVPASQSGTWTVQPGNTPNTAPWLVQQIPQATGPGLSVFRLHATTGAQGNIKASAGAVYEFELLNTNAAIRYIHFYNSTSATPETGGLTPVETMGIPAGAGAIKVSPNPTLYGTGISYAVTTDNAAVPAAIGAAGDIQGAVKYV